MELIHHPLTWVIAFFLMIAVMSLRLVGADQRGVIERMGRYHRLHGPGWHMIIPLIERTELLNPDVVLPGWRAYSGEALNEKLIEAFYAKGGFRFADMGAMASRVLKQPREPY